MHRKYFFKFSFKEKNNYGLKIYYFILIRLWHATKDLKILDPLTKRRTKNASSSIDYVTHSNAFRMVYQNLRLLRAHET